MQIYIISANLNKIKIIIIAGLMIIATAFWTYLPIINILLNRVIYDMRYSYGIFIPIFVLYVIWKRRNVLTNMMRVSLNSKLFGIAIILLGNYTMIKAAQLSTDWLACISVLPTLAGVALLLGNWPGLRWATPAIAYLGFMIPPPYRMEIALGWPLQRLATNTGAFLLQSFGLMAYADGNVIVTDQGKLGVAEACSGLSMTVLFIALATAISLIVHRPAIDRWVMIFSAIPIALIVNIMRITATGILGQIAGPEVAEAVYHDLAGWLMMPAALLLMGLELSLVSRLLIAPSAIEVSESAAVRGVK